MIQIYLGIDVEFISSSQGETEVGNHKSCIKKGLIEKFKDETFTEYLVEVDRNNYITNEDESLFSFGEIMQTVKKELIYIQNN